MRFQLIQRQDAVYPIDFRVVIDSHLWTEHILGVCMHCTVRNYSSPCSKILSTHLLPVGPGKPLPGPCLELEPELGLATAYVYVSASPAPL